MTIDSVLARIEAGLEPPSITRREVVLVAGPWLAGATGVVAALRHRLPEFTVLEVGELAAGEAPTAVVFVASATAPLTESDCALVDVVSADTDAVLGVVTKIDVHRTWREVLDADRALLASRAARYGQVVWVGAAAAPDLGAPVIDDLVTSLSAMLADDTLGRRNRLRAWENRLMAADDADGVAGVAALRDQRAALLRRFRLDKSERNIAMRSQVQQARVQLSYLARARCASVRAELQHSVATMTRREFGDFTQEVHRRAVEVSGGLQQETARHLAEVGQQLGLAVEPALDSGPVVQVGAAPLRSRSAETRLMMLLGAGFGLGVALTLSRLFADLAPRWAVGGALGGAAVGLAAALWVVGIRGLLHERAVLDRWVVEVTGGLRIAVEEWVATRVLAAEASWGRAAAERDAVDGVDMEETVARIDAGIRAQTVRLARAAAARERAVAAVRDEFDRGKPPIVAF
ncbi:hypothetical protein [Mycolicibacterium sarraceniae]|uniref:Uncharacterized protein n=1 Tax=Mycolicibacterium sarraceniae TaxID=1534348 RepID=A0A7I7SPL7_9MYCO|nr:hypothetical protein [Mycolicibacterium sarraceniae]BBY58703.1 hypothetical protein MSAR_18390 [Mycolicibacterium sarraceniae]